MRKKNATVVYLPHVSENKAGLLRYASELLTASNRLGIEQIIIVGNAEAVPDWLASLRYRVLIPRFLNRFSFVSAALRIFWLQFIYPIQFSIRNKTVLLHLAHESAPFPWWPQVCVIHDFTFLKKFSGKRNLLRKLQSWTWQFGLKRSTKIIAISSATKCDIVQILPSLSKRIHVIHEGVDRSIFNHVEKENEIQIVRSIVGDERFMLYVGTLAPHKNVKFLVQILEKMVVDYAFPCKLVVVGSHSEVDRLDLLQYAQQLGVESQICFPGFLPDEIVAALMRHCVSFTFASLNEGFGLAPVEAMACGAPVIAASRGSLPEVLGNGAILLPPELPESWAKSVIEMATSSEKRWSQRQAGLTRAQEFEWKTTAARTFRLTENAEDK